MSPPEADSSLHSNSWPVTAPGESVDDAVEAIREAESEWTVDDAREAELERRADMYLAACGAVKLRSGGRKNRASIFTEQQISDKCGHDWHPQHGLLKSSSEKMELEYMTLRDLRDIGHMCRIRGRQYAVVELWVCGLQHSDIAEALGESKDFVTKTLQRYGRKILDKWQSTSWYGMWTVYYELVNRR